MKIIYNENPVVDMFLTPAKSSDSLVWSKFVMLTDVDDGCLAWNGFTHSLALISDVSSEYVKNNFGKLDCFEDLIKGNFLVSENINELQRLMQTRSLIENLDFNKQKFCFIFTTYACNARCPYCYESQIPISSMDEKTAYNVADYLIKNRDDKSLYIRWFGGEPMVNSKVIDIICSELKNNNIPFKSSMISNAYLFDENKIKYAVDKWNLEWIQITLDGPERIYNTVKNYVNANDNPFEHIMHNIKLFTENKVKVNARFNVSDDNLDNYMQLIDVLEEKFKDNKYFRAYPKFLFDYYKPHSNEVNEKVIRSCEAIFNKLESIDMLMPKTLKNMPSKTHCLADNDISLSILPNGKFNKCHHEMPLVSVGDVVSGITDTELNDSFKERLTYKEKCKNCVLAADCIQLKRCAHKCNEVHIEYNKMWLEASIRILYNKWKQKNGK